MRGRKQAAAATKDLDRIISIKPDSADAYFNRGILFEKQGNGQKAIADFTQAIRIADRGYVIVHGKIEFEGGSAAELNNNELIRQFYLGS